MCVCSSHLQVSPDPSLWRHWPIFSLFMRAPCVSPGEAHHLPGKTYGTAGIWAPAVGPLRAISKSLGIKVI